ncbi:sigma-54 interaction domain-containing protein [Acidobacteriota bacterium]
MELDNRFFPLIFDTISHGIFTIDAQGRITSFNRRAEILTGYSRQEALGRQCADVFMADICRLNCPLKTSVQTGHRTEDLEVIITTKEGKKRPIAISTAALVDEHGVNLGGVEMFRDLTAVEELRKKLHGTYIFEDIVSKSRAMQQIFEILPLVANSLSTVLIQGESGTGKELVARAIHNLGNRKKHPLIAVNCGGLPENLLESELFGYKKGAFTDAKSDKPGRFVLADHSTILLDEVGELSGAMQVKLLRVLQDREFVPLGGTQPVVVDVRIIASTNRDLQKEVERRRFRKDLFYRLNVVKIQLPPLSERREDIPLLVEHFIKRFNAIQGRRIARCSERCMSALMAYSFPGNVREIENAIEHAFVVCVSDTIQFEDLPDHIIEEDSKKTEVTRRSIKPLETAEAAAIREALKRHKGSRKLTALELGVSRNTLWRKIKKYGIEKDTP